MNTAADLSAQLQWIAWAQTATAVGTLLLAVIGIAVGIAAFALLRAGVRLMRTIERQVEALTPRTEPLVERATQLATDATEISGALRKDLGRVHERIEELDRRVGQAMDSIEARARRFGAVTQVVQEEIEDILLDTVATARGVHVTAEALGGRATARADRESNEQDRAGEASAGPETAEEQDEA